MYFYFINFQLKNYYLSKSFSYIFLNKYFKMKNKYVLFLKRLFVQKRGERSEPIVSMIDQLEDLVLRCEDKEILDAVIIVNLQHIIHYKIASYGAICTYLKHLGLHEEAEIMHLSLEMEKTNDRQFSMIAYLFIDREAIAPSS